MVEDSLVKKVKPFDFRQIRKLSPRTEKKLNEVNIRFAQNLISLVRTIAGEDREEVLVSSHLAELEPVSVEKSAEEFDFTFKIEPGKRCRLALDRNLGIKLVSLCLGHPDGERSSSKELTRLEENALLQLLRDMVKELQNAWAEDLKMGELNFGYGKRSDKDRLVVSRFAVKFGITSGEMEIGYPLSLFDEIETGDSSTRMEYKQKIKELVEDSEVELTCILGNADTHSHASVQLTLNQIAELQTGNVILMDGEGDFEVTFSIQERNRFRGVPGIYNGKRGVRITSTCH